MRLCSIEGCGLKHYAKGLCKAHHNRAYHQNNKAKVREQKRTWRAAHLDQVRGYKKARRKANPEKAQATDRATYQKHAPKKRARAAAYRRSNQDKVRASRKAYYRKNRDVLNATNRRYYELNKTAVKAQVRQYQVNNPEKVRIHGHRRRARVSGAEGQYTREEWLTLLRLYGGLCPCCGECRPLTVDHVVPLSRGGSNHISNIQPLCKPCNSAKRDRHSTRYAPRTEPACV